MSNEIRFERRVGKRTYLRHACSFTITSNDGLVPFDLIELTEISEDGLSFLLHKDFGVYEEGDEIFCRIYFNSFVSQTLKYYLPLTVIIANSTEFIDKDGNKLRYGCSIRYEKKDFRKVLKSFIQFVESSSLYLKEDKGDYFVPTTVA